MRPKSAVFARKCGSNIEDPDGRAIHDEAQWVGLEQAALRDLQQIMCWMAASGKDRAVDDVGPDRYTRPRRSTG